MTTCRVQNPDIPRASRGGALRQARSLKQNRSACRPSWRVFLPLSLSLCLCLYLNLSLSIYISIYIYIYVHIYVASLPLSLSIYIYIYIYTYTYIYTKGNHRWASGEMEQGEQGPAGPPAAPQPDYCIIDLYVGSYL